MLKGLMECAGIFEQKLLDQLVFNQNPNKVFIYIVNLAECKLNINPFLQCLAAEEQVQASKYYTDHLRRQYIISHGILRYILGYYTKQHPKDIIFSYGAYGKPFLKNQYPNILQGAWVDLQQYQQCFLQFYQNQL